MLLKKCQAIHYFMIASFPLEMFTENGLSSGSLGQGWFQMTERQQQHRGLQDTFSEFLASAVLKLKGVQPVYQMKVSAL